MRSVKKFFLFFLIAWPLAWIGLYFLADKFHPSHVVTEEFPPIQAIHAPNTLLEQPFYYLAKGSQCYCFESADNHYVLKLFRGNRYRIPALLTPSHLPTYLTTLYKEKRATKLKKWQEFVTSCSIATEQLSTECALVYTHFQKTAALSPLTLYDKIGRKYCLDPNKIFFVVQKKAEPCASYKKKLISENKLSEVQRLEEKMEALLAKRRALGIEDRDPALGKNMGVLEGEPLFIDIGAFY